MSDELDLGNLAITITAGEPAEAKFDLPNGTSVTRTFPESGTINMRLGLGLSLSHQRPPAAGGGGEPEWLPEGATAHADPVLENYYADGEERVLSDLFTGVNARDASGITCDGVADNYPLATALFRLATPESGWSAIVEWEQHDLSGFSGRSILLAKNGGMNAEVFIDPVPDTIFVTTSDGGFDAESAVVTLGTHTVGVTFDGTDFTFASLDGASFDVATPGGNPLGEIAIFRFGNTAGAGGSPTLGGTLKKITMYAPLDQAGLNARTA